MGYKIANLEKGVCLECGSSFYGRSDKKFCSKECKNRFHNNETSENNRLRAEVYNALSINHDILLSLIRRGIESIPLEELESMGYNVNYVTGHRKGLYKHDEYSCFNVRFYRSPTRIFRLHKVESPNRLLSLPSQDPSNRR